MSVRDDMLNLVRTYKRGYTLPQPFYSDPEFFKVDMESIWYRDWLFVGHTCEVAKAGQYFTVQIGAYPVVVIRDREGAVRAFHNSCRHRGSRVCTGHKGATAKMVCPYHQWTYDLDGKLLFARQMAEGFDSSAHGMKPVACETVAGYVFICLAQEPEDFQPFRSLMEPYFAPHRFGEAKIAHEVTIHEKGNWKLVWENNRECYHCAGNHPELCRTYPEAPTVTGVGGAENDPRMVEHWQRCEAAGLPSRFRIDPRGQYRANRSPLLDDAVSYTMSGKPAVQRYLSEQIKGDSYIGALMLFHYPTSWNHALLDHAVTFRVLPVGPTETTVTTKWLVHKDAVEGVDYKLDELIHVWMETNDQDRRIVEENSLGVQSPAYEPGPYSDFHEGGVAQFIEWYAGCLERRLSDPKARTLRKVA